MGFKYQCNTCIPIIFFTFIPRSQDVESTKVQSKDNSYVWNWIEHHILIMSYPFFVL
jgi:hypothetical protein